MTDLLSPKEHAKDVTGGLALWRARVTVLPKTGVNDPEGEAIRGGLAALGHDSVRRVLAGHHFELEVEASDLEAARRLVERVCDQLLANPVIQMYRIEVDADDGPNRDGGGIG